MPDDDRSRRGQIQQGADRVVGAAASSHLEPVAKEHKGGQNRRCLVEDVAAAAESHDHRVGPAGGDGHCDQDHHVQGSRSQGAHGSVEKDPAGVPNHGQAQDQLEDIVAQTKGCRDGEVQDLAAD